MTEQEWLSSEDPAAMLRTYTSDDMSWPAGTPAPKVSDRKLKLFAQALMWTEGVGPTSDDEPVNPAAWLTAFFSTMGPHVHEIPRNATALLRDIVGNHFRPMTIPYYRACRKCKRRPPDQWWEICPFCQPELSGFENRCDWLTPQVLTLAQAAYLEHLGRVCGKCKGRTYIFRRVSDGGTGRETISEDCPGCHGTGRVEDGTLDPARLEILADALEEAGVPSIWCPECNAEPKRTKCEHAVCLVHDRLTEIHPLLAHLRSPAPHVRGCWAVDLIRGLD